MKTAYVIIRFAGVRKGNRPFLEFWFTYQTVEDLFDHVRLAMKGTPPPGDSGHVASVEIFPVSG